ncbi:hypothetical protein HKD37_06G016273 [Glycine soja]|nr:hypothetical protein GmHk_06G016485 [Glycine max]
MACNFSSLVLVFLVFVASSYAIQGSKMDAICKQTENPTFYLIFSILSLVEHIVQTLSNMSLM